jgi:hypothetical protein
VNTHSGGFAFRQSSDGKLLLLGLGGDSGLFSQDFSSPTVFSASNANTGVNAGTPIWLQVNDDGTNRKLRWSKDGYNYQQLHSEGRTTFLTADEIGFWSNTSNATWDASVVLLSWAQT